MDDRQKADLIAGVFVGGASSRMGEPKGLLGPPDGSAATLVERLVSVLGQAGFVEPLLVGDHPAYRHLGVPHLADAAPDSGPLGGIVALLEEGARRGARGVIVVACDLPYVESNLISRLCNEHPLAAVVCPHEDDRHQPLFARYGTQLLGDFSAALESRRLALQALLRAVHTERLVLSDAERRQLIDWDTPRDVQAKR